MITAFTSCLIIFNITGKTKNTAEVTLYFIPDVGLCLVNTFMTLNLLVRHKGEEAGVNMQSLRIKLFLRITAIIVCIGFYVNIASAIFYILLALEKTFIRSMILEDSSLIDYLWRRFADIMKFKVVATLHAITFKLYFDLIRREHHSNKDTTTNFKKQE